MKPFLKKNTPLDLKNSILSDLRGTRWVRDEDDLRGEQNDSHKQWVG